MTVPDLTDEQRALVERLDAEKPDFDELIADGTIAGEPGTMLAKVQLDGLVEDLKARRLSLGLQIKDVVAASGLSRVFVSQLENGWLMNPRFDSVYRYAMALGTSIELKMVELDDEV